MMEEMEKKVKKGYKVIGRMRGMEEMSGIINEIDECEMEYEKKV